MDLLGYQNDRIKSVLKYFGLNREDKDVKVTPNLAPGWKQPTSFMIVHNKATPTEGWKKTVGGGRSTTVVF